MPQTYSNNEYIYSVDMMFAYIKDFGHPVTVLKVDDYRDALEMDGWGDPSKEIYYSAMDVIKNPKKYQDDYKRILLADLSYPIIVSDDNYIVDGIHRLTKAVIENRTEIKAYVFDHQLMNKFIIAKKEPNVWEKVDNMKLYEIISLYNQRFCHSQTNY